MEAVLRAISDPRRREIIRLVRRRELSAGEIAARFEVSRPAISQHLKVLKDAGIVRGTIEGPNTCYCLEPTALEWLRGEFGALSDRCC